MPLRLPLAADTIALERERDGRGGEAVTVIDLDGLSGSYAPGGSALAFPLVDARLVGGDKLFDFQYRAPLGGIEVFASGLIALRCPGETEIARCHRGDGEGEGNATRLPSLARRSELVRARDLFPVVAESLNLQALTLDVVPRRDDLQTADHVLRTEVDGPRRVVFATDGVGEESLLPGPLHIIICVADDVLIIVTNGLGLFQRHADDLLSRDDGVGPYHFLHALCRRDGGASC